MAKRTIICRSCQHPKGQHSIGGCAHMFFNHTQCPCNVNRSDPSQFEEGEPLND
jgi:hypothetical protein